MKFIYVSFFLMSSLSIAQQPTMSVWTNAWHEANKEVFKNVYAEDALIFPPNKPMVQGNENILGFMKGGLGKVDVIFEPDQLEVSEKLAFEYGIFKDKEIVSGKTLGKGTYAVTWVLKEKTWKVQCHTWSMPVKK